MTNPETQRGLSERSISGTFEIPDLPEWFEEPGEKLGYVPWQHTPLDPFSTEMRGHQAELRASFDRLAEAAPPGLKNRGYEKLVRLDLMSGMTMREAQCAANFHDWADNHPGEVEKLLDDPGTKRLLLEALAGLGSARGQLELLQHAPSLRSLDLQVLTTPLGYRRQHAAAMRQELREALRSLGAIIYEAPQWIESHPPKIASDPARRIHASSDPLGLLVTYKRKVAELIDPTNPNSVIAVMEREAWLVPTSIESGFSQDIAFDMWRSPSWAHTMPRFAAQVQRYVMGRIGREQGVIPLSIATYATR